jgi:hypothetical protein
MKAKLFLGTPSVWVASTRPKSTVTTAFPRDRVQGQIEVGASKEFQPFYIPEQKGKETESPSRNDDGCSVQKIQESYQSCHSTPPPPQGRIAMKTRAVAGDFHLGRQKRTCRRSEWQYLEDAWV